jgi:hypothetical protein
MPTDSLFDPNSPNVERGAGNQYLGEPGISASQMPPDLVDPKAEPDDDAPAAPFTDDPDEAAERLAEMESGVDTDAVAPPLPQAQPAPPPPAPPPPPAEPDRPGL